MKTLMVGLIVLSSVSAFAQERIEFHGKIKNSQFTQLNNKECSIVLEQVEAESAQEIAFKARAKIKGILPLFNKRLAPGRKMNINKLTAQYDSNSRGKDNVLVGMGSKYRGEVAQRLYVNFNDDMSEVIS